MAIAEAKRLEWLSQRFENISQVKGFLSSLKETEAWGAKVIPPAYNIDPRFEVIYLGRPEIEA